MIDDLRNTMPRTEALIDLDLRRHAEPGIVAQTLDALAGLPPGGGLDVTVGDSRTMLELPQAARKAGHDVLGVARVPDGFRIRLRRRPVSVVRPPSRSVAVRVTDVSRNDTEPAEGLEVVEPEPGRTTQRNEALPEDGGEG